MNLLEHLAGLLHEHQQFQQHAPTFDPGPANHIGAPMQHATRQMQPMQYAQYKNADGSGGGFGPNNPNALQVRPQQGGMQQQGYNNPQQGYGMQVQGVGGMPQSIQLPQRTYWQNTDDVRRDMYNPQVQDDGYYYDN